jgi:hypothetical protein
MYQKYSHESWPGLQFEHLPKPLWLIHRCWMRRYVGCDAVGKLQRTTRAGSGGQGGRCVYAPCVTGPDVTVRHTTSSSLSAQVSSATPG